MYVRSATRLKGSHLYSDILVALPIFFILNSLTYFIQHDMIKHLNMKFLIIAHIVILAHCTLFAQWTSVASPPDSFRTDHSFGFAIDSTGYLLGGQTPDGFSAAFYSYSPELDEWTQLPDFPGGTRGYGIGDVWENKAYFGFGLGIRPDSIEAIQQNDIWVFDHTTNAWTELSPCPCLPRLHPAFVTHKGTIYVGLGSAAGVGNLDDWWAYHIATDTWTQKAFFPSHTRHHPFQFAIGDYVYTGFGHGSVEPKIYDTWYQYNPENDSWLQVASIPGEARVAGTQFSHNGFGYVLSGDGDDHDSMETGEFWRYDADSNKWSELPPHPGSSRWAPASFIIDNEVYVINGSSFGNYDIGTYKYDLGEPSTSTADIFEESINLEIYPNPFTHQLTLKWNTTLFPNDAQIRLLDPYGRIVYNSTSILSGTPLVLPDLVSGIYFLEVITQDTHYTSKIVMKLNE